MEPSTHTPSARLSRRGFLAAGGSVLLSSGWLAACGNEGSWEVNEPLGNLLKKKVSGTLRIGTYKDPSFALIPSVFIPEFEKKTGVKVEWLEQDYGTWFEKAVNDAQSGVGAFDIYILDDPWMPQFAANGLVSSLDGTGLTADSDLVSVAVDTAIWPPRLGPVPPDQKGRKKQLYGVPILSDTPILSYRTDIFDQAPTRMDEIIAKAREVGDVDAGRYGWVFRGAKGNPAVTSWFPTLYSAGGKFFDDDWKVAFNDDIAVRALRLQLDLLKISPPNIGEFDSDQEGAALLNGQAFAANLWTGWAANALDPKQSRVIDRIGFGVPPAVTSPASELGIQIAAISRASKNPVAAAHFISWFTSPDIQLAFARAGGTPTRTSAFEDRAAKAKTPYLSAVQKTLAVAKARPRTSLWSQVEDLLGTQLNVAFTQGPDADAKALLDTAADAVSQLLDQAGYYN